MDESPARWWWREAPNDGGRDYGNANVWSFRPTIETFVRETGQNIIDASIDGRVDATYRLILLEGADLAAFKSVMGWEDLAAHIRSLDGGKHKLGRYLSDGLGRIESEGKLLLLRIEDRNAIGLRGEEFEDGPFMALCRNNLDSQKRDLTSGGAFGLGKAALWLTSRISTVLFNSDLQEPIADGNHAGRLFGRVELGWHSIENQPFAGPGFFGRYDGPRRTAVSHWGDRATADALHVARDGASTGTSILVVGFHDPSGESEEPRQLAAQLRIKLAENFFPAILDGRFRPTVELYHGREQVLSETVDPEAELPEFSELLRGYHDDAIDTQLTGPGDTVLSELSLRVPARRPEAGDPHAAREHHPVLLVRVADKREPSRLNSVALFRKQGMVIEYLNLGGIAGARPFHAVVLCGEARRRPGEQLLDEDRIADVFLRSAEPPAHDEWTSTQELKVAYQVGGKKAIDDLKAEIRQRIRELVVPEERTPSDGPRILQDLLRMNVASKPAPRQPQVIDLQGAPDATGAWVVTGRIRVKPAAGDPPVRIRLVPAFQAETGSAAPISWARIEAVSLCTVDGQTIVVDQGRWEASFRAVTDPTTHPIAAADSILTVVPRLG